MSTVPRVERSYIGPDFESAKVHDAMRVGVVTCRPETRLADVARMMVGYDIHSVVVADVQGEAGLWGIVTAWIWPASWTSSGLSRRGRLRARNWSRSGRTSRSSERRS